MVQATSRDLYGTTSQGGAGSGTIFKITPSGTDDGMQEGSGQVSTLVSFGPGWTSRLGWRACVDQRELSPACYAAISIPISLPPRFDLAY